MQYVLVLDCNKKPLDPCHPARARELLKAGRAAVYRVRPFTIIIKDRTQEESTTHDLRVKIDPGSKTTGIAVVRENDKKVIWAAELQHRGDIIHNAMLARKALRGARRGRNCRYRPARFDNRRRKEGWLPPSLQSRIANTLTWIKRLARFTPIAAVSMELVKFDTQLMTNPEISGVEYQQGELQGYEVREYLLEKWGHQCAYCGTQNVPLQIEHIIPKARGGSNRVSNLTLSCEKCNQKKGIKTAAEFGHSKVQEKAKKPLKDVAAVNTIRWALWNTLSSFGLPIECGTGGRTKFNRMVQNLPKTHWIDAACVGQTGNNVFIPGGISSLIIKAFGHGRRSRCVVNRWGFPVTHTPRAKSYMGFKTGDLVRAAIPLGKHKGSHVGRVVIRFKPQFMLKRFGVHPKYLSRLQISDGYEYSSNAMSA